MSIFKKSGPPRARRVSAPGERYTNEPQLDTVPDGGGFSGSSPTALQVGAFLRQAREQQGLTIGDLSRQTRIRDVYLLALEAGEMEKLPGTTFVAGFLRLYAETLGLTDRGFVEEYLARSGHDDTLQTELFPAPTTSRHRPSVVMVLGGLIGLLSLFFVYENYFSLLSRSAQAPDLPVTTPRRADSMPVGSGMKSSDPDPLDTLPEEGDGRGSGQESFADGFLSRFFDQPAPQSGVEEETEQTPPPTSTKQVGTGGSEQAKPAVGRAVSDKTAPESAALVSKKATHTPKPIGESVEKRETLPEFVTTEEAVPSSQESERDPLAVVARAWLDRATAWFDQVTQGGEKEPEQANRDQTEPEPDPDWPPPVTSAQKTEKPVPVMPPVQPAPVLQSIPRKMSAELKPTPRESTPKPMEPVVASQGMVESDPPVKPKGSEVSGMGARPMVPVVPKHEIETVVPAQVAAKPVVPAQTVSKPEVSASSAPSPTPVIPPAASEPAPQGGGDPAALIVERYPEKVKSDDDLKPESPQAVSLLASELVWVQIHDAQGRVLKDMVMQPNQLFRVPVGGQFSALLGNAGAVRVRVGNRALPPLGAAGEEISGVDLTPSALLKRAKP